MTRRERLMAIFCGKAPDRPAVKLWGLDPGQSLPHPAYRAVHDAGVALTDIVSGAGCPFDLHCGCHAAERIHSWQEPTESPEWVHVVETYETPCGPLRSVFRKSTLGKPGYEMEHALKEPEDIKRLLSIPYEPYPFDCALFHQKDACIGEQGIVFFYLDHAMYGLQRLIGSENFALWSVSHPELLLEAMHVFAERIRAHAVAALDAGLRPVFGWVGPELCIPPLMPPEAFRDYVVALDKPLIDLMHDAGCPVWVHSHGKMGPVLEGFVEMGVDVLNPIEPPPMGDITLGEAFERVGERMGLEGNIETHDLMMAEPDELREKLREAIEAGSGGRRFILCASSAYHEDPMPTARNIENLLIYIEEGVRLAESVGAG